MKKVYGNIRSILIPSVPLAFMVPSEFIRHDVPIYLLCFLGGFLLFGIWMYFSSLWAYDEKGWEFKSYRTTRSASWKDVDGIYKRKYSDTFEVYNRKYVPIYLGELYTRDYLNVVSDVVKYVQKENPEAEIHPRVLRRLEKVRTVRK